MHDIHHWGIITWVYTIDMKPLLRSLLYISIGVYIGFGIYATLRQDKMLYFPETVTSGISKCAEENGGKAISDLRHPDLHGVLYEKSTTTLIVIYHGNATNACERQLYRTALLQNPASILVVSYPGYLGDLTPPSSTRILKEVSDVVLWATEQRYLTVGVIGESIGVGPASFHAALYPVPLALIAPYPSLSALASKILPLYPVRAILRDDFYVSTWARAASRVLVIAGSNDTTIPKQLSENLFASLPQKDKYFLELPYDHDGLLGSAESARMIARFLSMPL
jgi:pimeloyl-ACP methyl ester carboxylesterase